MKTKEEYDKWLSEVEVMELLNKMFEHWVGGQL
jgi:hypothetical protein